MKIPRSTSSVTRCGCASGVGDAEGAAPRAAEHLPAVDAEVLAQALDVGDEVPGGVVVERGERLALAAAALVEQDDAVARRVEEAPVLGVGAAAGPAVQEHHRLAGAVARLLEVEVVPPRTCSRPKWNGSIGG